jgi:hypothetical protein
MTSTVEVARKALSGPLIFGNLEQIKALRFLVEVEGAKEAIKSCPDRNHHVCDECGGTGLHECECSDEHDCGYCNGTGGAAYSCLCVLNIFSREAIEEAVEQLERERYMYIREWSGQLCLWAA